MSWDILHDHFYRPHHSLNHLQILKVQRKPIGSVSPKRPGEVNTTKDTYIQYHNHHHTIQSLSHQSLFFSARHAISSWGEQLWVLKSSSKLNRFPASRPTSTRPSGLVWSLGMLWLGARQQVSGKLFFGELGSTVHLVWFCSFLTCVTIILWSQEAGGNPDLWGLVSRGDQHLNQYEFIDCYHVLRWSITWRRQKSSQQMTLLRELKLGQPGLPSDRWEIIPFGLCLWWQFKIMVTTKKIQFRCCKTWLCLAGHYFGEGTSTQAWWGDLLNQDLW